MTTIARVGVDQALFQDFTGGQLLIQNIEDKRQYQGELKELLFDRTRKELRVAFLWAVAAHMNQPSGWKNVTPKERTWDLSAALAIAYEGHKILIDPVHSKELLILLPKEHPSCITLESKRSP
ncbi:MAG: hypothetical protein WCV92_01005 [Candidatus Buchananbacteria bacterium]